MSIRSTSKIRAIVSVLFQRAAMTQGGISADDILDGKPVTEQPKPLPGVNDMAVEAAANIAANAASSQINSFMSDLRK